MVETLKKIKVLTVGDGDLSLSLALSRAYGEHHIDLTASVLESDRETFLRVFPEAPLNELQYRRVSVMYGVDATQLHRRFAPFGSEGGRKSEHMAKQKVSETPKIWDLISFHHPHLGISNLEEEDEAKRAILHHCLLSHYLHSAAKVSKLVHVCLTGTQPITWKLLDAAMLQNLILVKTFPDTKPFANIWTRHTPMSEQSDVVLEHTDGSSPTMCNKDFPEAGAIEPHFAAPRRYRNGKLGRHWLSRYGYRHRRTEGVLFKGSTKDANVSESMHFVFATNPGTSRPQNSLRESDRYNGTTNEKNRVKLHVCPICQQSFDSESELRKHKSSPVQIPSNRNGFFVDAVHSSVLKDESQEEAKLKIKVDDDSIPYVDPSRGAPQRCLGPILEKLCVTNACRGKRLRWFLQHSKFENLKFTKRVAELAIKSGLVLLNGEVAHDSSRILKVQDTVSILEKKEGTGSFINQDTLRTGKEVPRGPVTIQKLSSKNPKVEILERSSNWLVAMKPSGMRTKGNAPGTLESSVSEQEGIKYASLSSLETSCSGLCVLAKTSTRTQVSIRHFLTVLVHGHLPRDEWFPSCTISLPLEAKWRQKKKIKKRKHSAESNSSAPLRSPSQSSSFLKPDDDDESSQHENRKTVSAEVYPRESTKLALEKSLKNPLRLSTLEVVTPEPSSSSICHYFRQEGFPVVGDSFCKQEYSRLKRSIRNRLKDKLCIGCFKVEVEVTNGMDQSNDNETASRKHVIEIQSPDKFSATFWEKFLEEETAASGNAIAT